MENTRKIYFKDNRKFLKYAILKEHEWYLYRFQKNCEQKKKQQILFQGLFIDLVKIYWGQNWVFISRQVFLTKDYIFGTMVINC